MKIAQFNDPVHPFCSPAIFNEDLGKYTDYVRISDWVEIDFPPRAAGESLPESIAALDNKIAATRAEHQKQINALETARANLLALPAPTADGMAV